MILITASSSILCTPTTRSPSLQRPILRALAMASSMEALFFPEPVCTLVATTGMRPRTHMDWRAMRSQSSMLWPSSSGMMTVRMGMLGRYLARRRAVRPVLDSTIMHDASVFCAARTAEEASDSMVSMGKGCALTRARKYVSYSANCSASWQIMPMMRTASTGCAPAAVSPESMTQSVPSSTALATSVASARVGRGFCTIDSSIWVAVMTNLPAWLQSAIMRFWAMKIFSIGISIPRSPRATMTPSLASTICAKLSRPSWFSTLEMIWMFLPLAPSTLRMWSTSEPLRTNDAATKSTLFFTPQLRRSSLSFSVMVGRSTTMPGRFMFLRSPRVASLRHFTWMVPALGSHEMTSRVMEPSAQRITLPGDTSRGRLG
mmetsp:Transcript_32591/g.103862  ORF Transcript_32591/g.103862 Transcript_32591/m.103862 type:complete len:375 (-) Transcript_32591:593-1717(-)